MSEYYDNQDNNNSYQQMPKKGLAVFWMVIGFLTGVLWGCLAS